MKENFTNSDAQSLIKGKLSRYFGVNPENATKDQFYKAIVMSVRDILLEKNGLQDCVLWCIGLDSAGRKNELFQIQKHGLLDGN